MIRRWIRQLPLIGKRLGVRTEPPVKDSVGKPARAGPVMAIYESELRAIGHDTASWQSETGGDLFGIWEKRPVIYLATLAGPSAIRDQAHFRLDVEYLREISIELETDWGLRYLGDWHSHHRLGLTAPSSGDQSRIVRLGKKNDFDQMAEIIACQRPGSHASTDIYPYLYELPDKIPVESDLIVLRGASPVREALEARDLRPEQRWDAWTRSPIDGIYVKGFTSGHDLASPAVDNSMPANRAIAHVHKSLSEAAGQPVEMHETSFGHILAVPAGDNSLVGIALERSWPCPVLEVHFIDRSRRNSTRLDLAVNSDATVPESVVRLYHASLAAIQGIGLEEPE